MKTQNKHLVRSRISERKYREIIKYFAFDFSATQVAELTNLNRNTVNRYFELLRESVARYQEQTAMFSGEVELDESYFGGKRKGKDKRGRCTIDKVPVFGIKKRDGKVYTQIIKNASQAEIEQKLPRSPAKRFTSMCYTVIGVALSLTRPHKLFRKGSFLRNITRREKLWASACVMGSSGTLPVRRRPSVNVSGVAGATK